MKFKVLGLVVCWFIQINGLRLNNNNFLLDLLNEETFISLTLRLDEEVKLTGRIGEGHYLELPENCEGSSCTIENGNITLTINNTDSGFLISWKTNDILDLFQDCIYLNANDTNWFGGPEKWEGAWPIESVVYYNRTYTTTFHDSGGISERYWLNSKGAYVFVADKVPLYIDQNSIVEDALCLTAWAAGPYARHEEVILEYNLVAKADPKEAHLHAVNNHLGKPSSLPNEWVIRNPIWTTWAKYKTSISDDIVRTFATDIANHGFTGQIEIDDNWETCYGSLVFNEQFENITETVRILKNLGFTVTLWTHPFVDHDCTEADQYGEENGYFVRSSIDNSDVTSWWNSDDAHHLDFTNQGAREWFTSRLKTLQELHGIDSFKFDAGEVDWAPQSPILTGDVENSPNALTAAYVKTAATFPNLLEIRTGWRTQNLGVLVRMLDRDSRWGLDNGLHSLITTVLQFNINGYVFVLPDMIGGNGYNEQPTAELMARWSQVNAFLPTVQLSYLPWEVTSDEFDTLAIVQRYLDLHRYYSDNILAAMNNSIANGTPVNPPIWWVDPLNPDALKCNDEFLLGEEILVAPIIEEGATSRDIVIPRGLWRDGNDGTIYEGPQILLNYFAPIDILPFFVKQ